MLGLGGLQGDEVSGVGVDVVEVGVVVVVVVGVERRHLLDAGGDAPHRLHVWLRGRPTPHPPPFGPPSPRGSRALSSLSPGAQVALALALGSLPGPVAFVPLSTTWVPPTVTCAPARTACACAVPVPMPLAAPRFADCAPLHSMCSVTARLGALLAPLRVLPVPLPFPCSVSRVVLSAARALARSAAAGLGALPRLHPRSLPRAPRPAPCACPWAVPLSPPVPRSAFLWPAPCPACALSPPSRITRRACCCRRSCGSVTPGGVRSGARGRTGRCRPVGKAALGGFGLGGLVWVWLGLVWARYFAPSLPSAAAAVAPGEAPGARAGATPALAACRGPRSGPRRGLLGLRSQPPVRLGPPPQAGRQGSRPGRRGWSPRPAQVPGSTARCPRGLPGAAQPAARPAPLPAPAAAPRAPRGPPPRILGTRRSGSGTGSGGGRPARGSHQSPTSLLSS